MLVARIVLAGVADSRAEEARRDQQLPERRALSLWVRVARWTAPPVHRDQQRRGAILQPRSAALGVRSSKHENNYDLDPALVPLDQPDVIDGFTTGSALERFGYDPAWRKLSDADAAAMRALMSAIAPPVAGELVRPSNEAENGAARDARCASLLHDS
jgi:hypothetical protein